MKPNALALTLTLSTGLLAPLAAQLEIKDTKGKHLDIVSGDKVLVRYMYAVSYTHLTQPTIYSV